MEDNGIIQGCPFCDCGTLMVCLNGYSFTCPNPDCHKKFASQRGMNNE